MSAGIDYGLGQTNINRETGIRYGVISQHSVGQAWYDEAEADYGKPCCPKCGNEALEYDDERAENWDAAKHECADFMCDGCEYVFGGDSAFGDEPLGWSFVDDDYDLVYCLDTNIMVLKSPYYTPAKFCSPCVPGAGDLDNPVEDGAKSYCLGHDWFEDSVAPYPVYSVESGQQVLPQRGD